MKKPDQCQPVGLSRGVSRFHDTSEIMTQKATPLRGINPDFTAQIDRAAHLEQRRKDALYTYKRDRTREVSRAAWQCAQAWAAGSAK